MSAFLDVKLIGKNNVPVYNENEIQKNHCYLNIFSLNANIYSIYRIGDYNNSYVLCYVDGVPHCILKYKGVYYDPTLQVHDHIKDREYVLVKEFSYTELYRYIKKNNGIGCLNGQKYYIPPRIDSKGEIKCTECD